MGGVTPSRALARLIGIYRPVCKAARALHPNPATVMTKREKVDLRQRVLDTAAELFYRDGVRSRRSRPHRRRVGRREDDALLPLPLEGRARRRVASSPRRRMDELARGRSRAPARQSRSSPCSTHCASGSRRPRSAAARSSTPTPSWAGATRRRRRSSPRTSGRSPSTSRTSPGRRAPPKPDALARELLLLVDGAIVTASIQGNARPADDAREAAAKVIAGSSLTPGASATR